MLLASGLLWSGISALGQAVPADGRVDVDDATRAAVRVTAYDLEAHLQLATGGLEMLARVTVRNGGKVPVGAVALEVSSALRWEEVSGGQTGQTPRKLPFDQHRVETDADHTGAANEAVVRLAEPLGAGESTVLTVFYGGVVERVGAPLVRAGAPPAEVAAVDWDFVGSGQGAQSSSSDAPELRFRGGNGVLRAGLRGFGEVLWYPVSAPQVFLGDGAKLARAVGEQMLAGETTTARLRLLVEDEADAGAAEVFFCGREAPLVQVKGATAGEATGEVPAGRVGFGPISLFVTSRAAERSGRTVAVVSADPTNVSRVEAAARGAKGLVTEWMGGLPERQPVLLDLAGVLGEGVAPQPFAQGAMLVEGAAEAANRFAMTRLLTHGWFAARGVWLDEGVAQLLPLVAIEREEGRAVEEARLRELQPALSLAESGAGSEALVRASREVFYRNKAVLVLNMLRGMVGDEVLQAGLRAVRSEPAETTVEDEARLLERAIEAGSKRDLAWFFRDWVLEDPGLPDLVVLNAVARPIPGKDGALVAVEVRNDGGAGAEVPVTVRSGTLTATERLLVPAKGTAAVRIVVQAAPEEVQVNDGSVPEIGQSTHVVKLR